MPFKLALKKNVLCEDTYLSNKKRRKRLLTETHWKMDQEAIIFFDKLGFGWVLDNMMVEEMKLSHLQEESIVNKSLIRIIENLLDNPGA